MGAIPSSTLWANHTANLSKNVEEGMEWRPQRKVLPYQGIFGGQDLQVTTKENGKPSMPDDDAVPPTKHATQRPRPIIRIQSHRCSQSAPVQATTQALGEPRLPHSKLPGTPIKPMPSTPFLKRSLVLNQRRRRRRRRNKERLEHKSPDSVTNRCR